MDERLFSIDEAHAAAEAFLTSASMLVMPVVSIDGRPVGNGAPGLDRRHCDVHDPNASSARPATRCQDSYRFPGMRLTACG